MRSENSYLKIQAALLGIFSIFLLLALPFVAQAQTEPPPDMPPMPSGDRLAPPPTVYPPTQADSGAQVFYQVCMACHGDQGQGLTDEWRGVLDIADQNCWQSKCHSPNHPPGGFVFPKFVPSVVGAGVVARFETAYDLYTYLKTEMPFQAPGSLKDEEYWQLTAFLLRINQLDPGSQTLDAARAAQIPLRATLLPPQEPPEKTASEQAALVFLVVGAGLLVLIPALYYLRKRRRVKA